MTGEKEKVFAQEKNEMFTNISCRSVITDNQEYLILSKDYKYQFE